MKRHSKSLDRRDNQATQQSAALIKSGVDSLVPICFPSASFNHNFITQVMKTTDLIISR